MQLETNYSTLTWSDDETLVTKVRPHSSDSHRRFLNELRVNRMLTDERPPVLTPKLVAADLKRQSLTFEAVAGVPLGAKYPTDLAAEAIDAIAGIATQLRSYRPRRRWFRRLNSVRRLDQAHRRGLLSAAEGHSLIAVARACHTTLRFAHGDTTARNVLRGDDGLTLIDWEWAGLYPPDYDRAFLWFSLVDVDGGRARVDVDEPGFLLSALLIQLWHLQWFVPLEFQAKHAATRDELVDRLLA